MNIARILNQENTTIVDVREYIEYIMGHIDGSRHIPLRKVMSRIEDFRNMSTPIVVYCRSGNRSEQAKLLLQASGIKEVYNGGGIDEMKYLMKAASQV